MSKKDFPTPSLNPAELARVEKEAGEVHRVGVGDATAIDNYLILMVKKSKFIEQKLDAVLKEATEYEPIISELLRFHPELQALMDQLLEIHEKLWYIEDRKRAIERGEDEDAFLSRIMSDGEESDLVEYLQLSRQVSKFNDVRASLKRQMNAISGSAIVEVKSHTTVVG